MKKTIDKSISFLNSYYYPVFISLLVLFGNSFSIELYTSIILLITVFVGLIVCDDLKFLISPLIMFIFSFSQKNVGSNKYYSKAYIIAIVAFGTILLSLFVLHFILHKKSVHFKALKESKISLGIALVCASYLLNGIFSSQYRSQNIIFALVSICSLGFIFFIFQINLDKSNELKDYLFFVLFLTSIVLTLELYLSFFNQIKIVDGRIIKETILLGWGMWNNIGGMLAFLLPVHIYYAITAKRFGYMFFFSGIISYLAIALTLSRSSLLVSSAIILACFICSCFIGNNKKINRIITISLALIGILGIILMWNKLSTILGDYLSRGFDDNGRFDIYKHGIEKFLKNPIFGGGFATDYKLEYEFIKFIPFRYHNTIIQIMATCGLFGLLSYLYHRFTTVVLFIKRRNIYSLFSALCIISLLLCSLLDNHFFNIYPLFVYALILVVNEKSNNY